MPNTITPFGFVKKSGDTMTGKLTLTAGPIALDVGLNTISLTNSVNMGACIKGGSNHYLNVRNRLDTDAGHLTCNKVVPSSTVDGVDVSEIGKPSGKMHLNAAQDNLVSGTITLVNLDTIPGDYTDGIENIVTHRITPGVAGFYAIKGQVGFKNLVADKRYQTFIRVSGIDICAGNIQASFNDYLYVPASVPCHYLSDADYVELMSQHIAGVDTVDLVNTQLATYLSVERVR